MSDDTHRVVLVSGANRGIGQAIAQHLYSAGYCVSIGVRSPAAAEQVVAAWDPARVGVHQYDALDPSTHQRWVDATVERFGRIDGLVNNAGISVSVDLADDNDAELDRLFAVNVKAPLSMTRKAMPYLRKSGAGRVINVASMAGKAVFGSGVGYSISKFALVAVSHATRHAGWADGVRCTALCPGYVDTDMTAAVQTVARESMISVDDLGRLAVCVMGLSNNASVAELIVNCRNDPMM